MIRLSVGSVWQSRYLLGQNVSNRTGFINPFTRCTTSVSQTQTDTHAWMGTLGLATVHRTSGRQSSNGIGLNSSRNIFFSGGPKHRSEFFGPPDKIIGSPDEVIRTSHETLLFDTNGTGYLQVLPTSTQMISWNGSSSTNKIPMFLIN